MTVDELTEYGMERMDDDDIVRFLSTHSLGVLGLPAEETPYLIPMSYGFDGESRLYFGYVVGSQSRKADLSEQTDTATFLVYSAETMFHWRSVLMTGTLRELPPDETSKATAVEGPMWRPELLETVSETRGNHYYELQIEEWTGLRHAIEPPAFTQRSSRDQPE
ncbi:Nitroimidazol reductase NimA, pyridoxamine 5'-phosphate oxidase superfamily [Natronorubrum sediminis]|uniref:Nitroimidazol reductase NimA, pyridoxamine 5'-phosphate oxidase superfamily n=1 Tax=Natronorubrum sediminis TaxID=640943 RepID=A0A1H6FYQ5_9EURY|nr:pyridoxamine 5'-phosphate oxidase family protein [Natronorubrum sediminis]SEH15440.1 Nitroimidazol reductase NimA, pyridoxamine 5'-phosphate oxidase superfamily [Natronorubrum sediminis]